MNCTYRLIYKKVEAFVADFVISDEKKQSGLPKVKRQMPFPI